MTISSATTIKDLVERYPYMLDWLVAYDEHFDKLKNPMLFNTMARVATLEAAASMAELDTDAFVDDVRTAVAQHEIAAEEAAADAASDVPVPERDIDIAEAVERQEQLKAIVRKLHDGASVQQVKAEFDALVAGVDSVEIARMEQALITEGMPVEEVQRLCDVHVSVFKDALTAEEPAAVSEGHPVDVYRRENDKATRISADLALMLRRLKAAETDEERSELLDGIGADLEDLAQIEVHYRRKENQLFPVLERHGVEGPTKVMWGLDDDIRARIKSERALVAAGNTAGLVLTLPETLRMIDDMVYKEDKILFPTALDVVTEQEWADMAAGDPEIGYAWSAGPSGEAARAVAAAPVSAEAGELQIPLPTGALTADQLGFLFKVLPFDLSYVDEHDRVRFYSEGERVFPRAPGVIGREVRNCHPPKSVDKVEEILREFKAGTKDTAEFWIQMGPKFIHIRYFAMRDEDGTYRGCLEVVQDATRIRGLTGQRRIVDW